MLEDDNLVIGCYGYDTSYSLISAFQILYSDGTKFGSASKFNISLLSAIVKVLKGNNNFIIAWIERVGIGMNIYGQIFDYDGSVLKPKFQINTNNYSHLDNLNLQVHQNGDFMVSYMGLLMYSFNKVFVGQILDNNGTQLGLEFIINLNIAYYTSPMLAINSNFV